jgi:rubrerythrin
MTENELELLKKAMLNEDEGAEYYLYQSKQWHEKSVCENFKMLAEEEELHSKWLRELFDSTKTFGDDRIMSFMKDIESPKLFDWTDIKRISDLSLKDVFKKAMDMEEASARYYQTMKEEATDIQLVSLLNCLIEWEISHYKSFKEVYESM